MPKVTMRLAKEVAAGGNSTNDYVPVSGEEVVVASFVADGLYAPTSVASITWDPAGADEEIIWSIKGSHIMPERFKIADTRTDGVKKLQIKVENGEANPAFMSAFAKLEVEIP